MCKIQYVRKSETFNIRLNIHRKDTKKPNAIEPCKHFNKNEHTSIKHGKFTVIEQLQYINSTPTKILKLRLRKRKSLDKGT